MADLSVVAANVVPSPSGSYVSGIAGVTITQGQAVYYDSVSSTWKLARSNAAGTAGSSTSQLGIACDSVVAGQPLLIQVSGNINPGATVAVGTLYMVSSAVAGNIAPNADIGAAAIVSVLGFANSTTNIVLNPNPTGIVHA